MSEYILDPGAELDLLEIWKFIAQDNPSAATRVVEAAYKTFDALASSPKLGKLRHSSITTENEIRSWHVSGFEKYAIFYQPIAEGIRVLRVYHGKRDIEALFAGK